MMIFVFQYTATIFITKYLKIHDILDDIFIKNDLKILSMSWTSNIVRKMIAA